MLQARSEDKLAPLGGLNVVLVVALPVIFANGLYSKIFIDLSRSGALDSILGTFRVSGIIWAAMFLAMSQARSVNLGTRSRLDLTVVAFAMFLACVPISGLAWVGLTFLGIYLCVTRFRERAAYRFSSLLFAISVSAFWAKRFSEFFMDYILRIDTLLVSVLTGTRMEGNLIHAADGVTVLQVLQGCSSFNNLSLTYLGLMVARSYFGTRGGLRSTVSFVVSCICVVAINTVRIGVIAIRPDLYEIVHGPLGANIANIITTLCIAAISIAGARQ